MSEETPRQVQTREAGERAIETGEAKDLKRYLKMQREDYEQANSNQSYAPRAANVTPAHF